MLAEALAHRPSSLAQYIRSWSGALAITFTPLTAVFAAACSGLDIAVMHRARRYDDEKHPRDLRRTTLTDGVPTLEQQLAAD
jgi:hypothetical protein